MKGIILAGEQDDRLNPLTLGIPKQLLPIYDKPMIFYPIETLVEVGIEDILIITAPQYITAFSKTLGDGSCFGAHFSYAVQNKPEGAAQAFTIGEDFMNDDAVCLITGDCIIIGNNRSHAMRKAIKAAQKSGHATIFVAEDSDPNQYGVLRFDKEQRRQSIECRSSSHIHYSITGLYVFPRGVAEYAKVMEKSERNRYEVTTLNQAYLKENKLQIQFLGDNFRWLDTNTFDNLLIASNYIKALRYHN